MWDFTRGIFPQRASPSSLSQFAFLSHLHTTLYLTWQAADRHVWTLDCISVSVIADPKRRSEKAGTMKTRAGGTGSQLILLVEDESIVREVTREVLERAGYRVLECRNAGEALHQAEKHSGQIDLLLTDVVMPEMNGADLANRLLELQPGLLTVFMSGYAESDVAQKIKRSSAMHIQKPFTMNVLLSRVAQALRGNSSGWQEDAASVTA